MSASATRATLRRLDELCRQALNGDTSEALRAAELYSGLATWRLDVLARLQGDRYDTSDEPNELVRGCASLATALVLEAPVELLPRDRWGTTARGALADVVSVLFSALELAALPHDDVHLDTTITALDELNGRLLEERSQTSTYAGEIALRRLHLLHTAHVTLLAAAARRQALHLTDGRLLLLAYLNHVRSSLVKKDRAAARLQVSLLNWSLLRQPHRSRTLDSLSVYRPRSKRKEDGDATRYSHLVLGADAVSEIADLNQLIRRLSKSDDYISSVDVVPEDLGESYPLRISSVRGRGGGVRPDVVLTRLMSTWVEAKQAVEHAQHWREVSVDTSLGDEVVAEAAEDLQAKCVALVREAVRLQEAAVDAPAHRRVVAWSRAAQDWAETHRSGDTPTVRRIRVQVPVDREDHVRRLQLLRLPDGTNGRFEFKDLWNAVHGWSERAEFRPMSSALRATTGRDREVEGPTKQYQFFEHTSRHARIAIVFRDGSEATLRADSDSTHDLSKDADTDYGLEQWFRNDVLPPLRIDAFGPLADCMSCLGTGGYGYVLVCDACDGTGRWGEDGDVADGVLWDEVKAAIEKERLLPVGRIRRAIAERLDPSEPTEPTVSEPTEPTNSEPTKPTNSEPTEPTAEQPDEQPSGDHLAEPGEPTDESAEPTEPTADPAAERPAST